MKINGVSDINSVMYTQKARAAEQKEPPKSEKAPDYDTYEKCTTDTDKVDREIRKLHNERDELENSLNSCADDKKAAELEKKLAYVENELRLKDNDSYRRSKAEVREE